MKHLLTWLLACSLAATTLQAAVPILDPRITGTNSQVASGTFTVKSGATLATEAGALFSFSQPLSLGAGGLGVSLTDPNADRLTFWDDSAGSIAWLGLGTGLSISGTTLSVDSTLFAPSSATYIVQTANGTLTNEQALGALATGLVKNTTTTGVLSIAAAGTDFVGPGAVTTSGLTMATARLLGRSTASTGAIEEITVGSGLNLSAGTLSATGGGGAVATDAIWDAKGDLAVGTGANTAAKLTVGTNGHVLIADSAEATGLRWGSVAGTGDVVGPASATDNALVRFDATTGKLVQNSNVTLGDSGTALIFSGAAGMTAGGSNQNVTLTPSGTGRVEVYTGNTPHSSFFSFTPQLAQSAQAANSTHAINTAGTTGINYVLFNKARGTLASPTGVNANDVTGAVVFAGATTSSTIPPTALIQGVVESNATSTNVPQRLEFQTSATDGSGLATRMRIDSAGKVIVGAGSPHANFSASSPIVQFIRDGGTFVHNMSIASATDTNAPVIQAFRSRGSLASPTATVSNDTLFSINVGGADSAGTNFPTTAVLRAQVDGTVGSGVVPARWEFRTSPTDGTGIATRISIGNAGEITFTPGAARIRSVLNSATTPAASLFSASDFLVANTDAGALGNAGIVASSGNVDHRYVFKGVRARGTSASPTIVSAGDKVFSLLAAPYDGSATVATVDMAFEVESASSGNIPTAVVFYTGATGTRTEKLRLSSAGNLTLASGGSLIVPTQTPASAAAAGTAGTITWDANYIYVCTATNTWKRVAIATW
jgi:hypothetical protein